jgi:hypothetical protein
VASLPSHIVKLRSNRAEVVRLINLQRHTPSRGHARRSEVQILNKSAVVLLVACWEAYIEDLATAAFDHLMHHATSPSMFPSRVLSRASKSLRENRDETKVWALAGVGWRDVLSRHRDAALAEHVGRLNTPKPKQVDSLFEELIGLKALSTKWRWQGTSAERATARLEALVALRGEIAHRVTTSASVTTVHVKNATEFLGYLSEGSSNAVARHLHQLTAVYPWDRVTYGGRK